MSETIDLEVLRYSRDECNSDRGPGKKLGSDHTGAVGRRQKGRRSSPMSELAGHQEDPDYQHEG